MAPTKDDKTINKLFINESRAIKGFGSDGNKADNIYIMDANKTVKYKDLVKVGADFLTSGARLAYIKLNKRLSKLLFFIILI